MWNASQNVWRHYILLMSFFVMQLIRVAKGEAFFNYVDMVDQIIRKCQLFFLTFLSADNHAASVRLEDG